MSMTDDFPQQGFISRFLRRPHFKGFAHDLEQRLTDVASAEQLHQSQVDEILRCNGISELSEKVTVLATVALKTVAARATMDDLRTGRTDHLLTLAARLGVNPDEIKNSLIENADGHFRLMYERLIAAGPVTVAKREQLIVDGKSVGLSDEFIKSSIASVAQPLINSRINEILEDTMMSPDEESSLYEYSKAIGIKLTFDDAETRRVLDLARDRWKIAQGDLPIVDCPLMLKRGEVCHAVVTASAYEERSRTVRVGYRGVSTRIKIVRGVYYNTGSYSGSRTTEAYSHPLGVGSFVVTNKRVIFSSAEKNMAFAIDSIIDWTLYSDGVELRRATGKPVTYVFGQGNGLFLEILIAARGKFIG